MNEFIAITGATALVGAGLEPVHTASIVLQEGRIREVGPSENVLIPRGAQRIDATGLTVMPGFIDAHVHIGFYEPLRVLRGGITTARDLAWPSDRIFELAERSQATAFDGPRLLAAGPMLTAPGGYPTRAAWAPAGTGLSVTTPDDARRAVADIVSSNADVVKVALNPEVGPTLDLETLRAIVDAAHERGLKVTGHVCGLDELHKALDAGLDELAHMLMSRERIPDNTLRRMVAQGMTVVPTLAIRFGRDRRLAIDNLRTFSEVGGRTVYGTDLGNAGPGPGIDRREIRAMATAGLSPQQIVSSATVESARWLGLHSRGVLEAGADADLVAVSGKPLEHAVDLTRVEMVWRQGRRVR
jgi:imidazolonepropionase-like amidohydrolase